MPLEHTMRSKEAPKTSTIHRSCPGFIPVVVGLSVIMFLILARVSALGDHESKRLEQALAVIKRLHGKAVAENHGGGTRVVRLILQQCEVRATDAKALSALSDLRFLSMEKVTVHRDAVQHLGTLPQLTGLVARCTTFMDDGFGELRGLQSL